MNNLVNSPETIMKEPEAVKVGSVNSRLHLARIIHEHLCCNRRSAATTSLRPAGSPLGPSTYCTSTHRVLRAPRAGLATRLSDFATNRHEQCGLDSVSFRLPSWQSLDGRPVPPANSAQGSA